MENNKKPDAENLLQVCDIYKSFGDNAVLKGMTLSLASGEVLSLIGGNGAGKSTLMKIIMGIYTHDSGKVIVNGKEMTAGKTTEALSSGVYMVPQEPLLFPNMTVEENILAILETTVLTEEERVNKMNSLIEEFRIEHIRKSKGTELSGGERRRVEIARALATDPAFILLDEPFAGIDPIAVSDIQGMIAHLAKRGIGILITDHNVRETLSIVDKAYILANGEILIHGDSETIANDPTARKYYLGENFSM